MQGSGEKVVKHACCAEGYVCNSDGRGPSKEAVAACTSLMQVRPPLLNRQQVSPTGGVVRHKQAEKPYQEA